MATPGGGAGQAGPGFGVAGFSGFGVEGFYPWGVQCRLGRAKRAGGRRLGNSLKALPTGTRVERPWLQASHATAVAGSIQA